MISTAENAGGSQLLVTYDRPGRRPPRKKRTRRDVEAEAQKAALREMDLPYPKRR
jgi:hypothetical protein